MNIFDWSDEHPAITAVVTVIATVALMLSIWVGASAIEARAFERVTGKHVSTWDAMFIELRVQEGAKP